MTIYVNTLNPAEPIQSEPLIEGPDHLREIKAALQNTFTNIPNVIDWNDVITTSSSIAASSVTYSGVAPGANVQAALDATYNQSLDRYVIWGTDVDKDQLGVTAAYNDFKWAYLYGKNKSNGDFLDIDFRTMFNQLSIDRWSDFSNGGIADKKILFWDATDTAPTRPNGTWKPTFIQDILGLVSVTSMNDVTNAGSGQIITSGERANLVTGGAVVGFDRNNLALSTVSNPDIDIDITQVRILSPFVLHQSANETIIGGIPGYTPIVNMDYIPTEAGTYFVTFSSTYEHSNDNIQVRIRFTKNGISDTNSIRDYRTKKDLRHGMFTSTFITCNGTTDEIGMEWGSVANDATMYRRTMTVVRVS